MNRFWLLAILLQTALPLAAVESRAQTPTLEFAPGAGNPTGNGPTVADQPITFQNNPDNPAGTTFAPYAPTTTATFVLSGQQYSNASGGRGMMFGGQSGGGNVPDAFPLFPLLNFISGSADGNYTAATAAGTGIATTANSGVALFADVRYLGAVAAGSRFRYADLTITFSQPMVNPVLHVTGLGSIGNGVGFTTELELLTAGVTLSRLSGSGELVVNNTQILSTAGVPNTGTGNGAASGSVLVSTPSTGITQLQLRLFVRIGNQAGNPNQNQPNGSWGDGWLLSVSKLTPTIISGTVFEDVNYGGGAGRPRSSTGAATRPGATVELYDNAGAFVATTTTDAGGQYAFTAAPGTYTVRVVNGTVSSSRPGYVSGLRAVQTYNGTTTRVGGENPAFADAAANTGSQPLASLTNAGTGTTVQSVAQVTASGAATSGPDFGFNFDLVVNTNNAGQGSLRQFILNSNALGNEAALAQSGSNSNGALPVGTETSIFMIPNGSAHPGLLASTAGGPASQLNGSGVAVITPTTALDLITGPNTGIDGSTQTFNIGNTNNAALGAGGTVGTAATALSTVNGPEVQLNGSAAIAAGLNLTGSADDSRVIGLAVFGFGNQADANGVANIVTEADNVVFERNVLGATATSFALPAGASASPNLRMQAGTGLRVTNNLIGFAGGTGVFTATGTSNITITGNEIRDNARVGTYLDGVDAHGGRLTVTGNLFAGNAAQGFDSFSSPGGNVVTGNTFTGNGVGTLTSGPAETAAVRIYGTGNTVSQNIINGNYGAGVEVVNGAVAAISQNSIYDNGTSASLNGTTASGQLGIDLLTAGDDENFGSSPYVTLNDTGDADVGGNGLLNFPVITLARIDNGNLIVQGFARPGATIELFAVGTPDARGFGEGRTYLGSAAEGGGGDTDAGTGSYSGSINGLTQGTDNTNRFSFSTPLTGRFAGLTAGTLLTSTATLGGATSEFSGNAPILAPLTGYVYEDANYGGGAGRSRATLGAAASGRPGANVELYTSSGSLAGTAVTDATGQYSFSVATGTYTVRVVNNSVLSGRAGATAAAGSAAAGYVSNQLAVQTYNGTTTRVGGENPARVDAAANTGSQALAALSSAGAVPQSIATANVGTGAANAGPDFGFNFDLVVNTNNAGQGSLRQFILNSNALGDETALAQSGANSNGVLPTGTETSIFMIPNGAAHSGLLASTNGGPASQLNASGVAVLAPTAALPPISGPRTSLDATTQTANIGNTNGGTLGAGGTVGTGATALSTVNRPEVQLVGSTALAIGLDVSASATSTVITGLAIYGFGNAPDNNDNANIRVAANSVTITGNVLGNSATNFSALPPVDTNADNVRVIGGTGLQVTTNLVGYANGKGVAIVAGVTGTNVTGNEIRSNARTVAILDGVDIQGASATVVNNLLVNNSGQGVDSFASAGGNTITGNTITGNGGGNSETAGVRLYGAGSSLRENIISNNYGAGVLVTSGVSSTTISRNSIFSNGTVTGAGGAATTGQLGIDLLSPSDDQTKGSGAFVTLNDNGDADGGGNGLLNFPVITGASIRNGNLVVQGFARPGSVIEFFAPGPADASGFGEGQTYLGSFTEGSTADTDGDTGPYAGLINGRDQGTDNTNRFFFTIPLSGRFAGLNVGALLTSTATLNGATSEFSGNATVGSGPLPVTLVEFKAQAQNSADALLTWTTAQEKNNDHFDVERSADGARFEKVGEVAGHGNSTTRQQYRFVDAGAARLGRTVYYRLRQVDYDGTPTTSDARVVRFGQQPDGELTVYPNPATSTLDVRFNGETGTVTIFNPAGMRVLTGQLATTLPTSLDVRQLPAGTYLVQVTAASGRTLTRRFVKY